MSVNPQHLRPGNWIYPTGRSKYVVVTGLLLGIMEKNEDLCKEFEGIELTGELLEAARFIPTPTRRMEGMVSAIPATSNTGICYMQSGSIGLVSIVNDEGEQLKRTVVMCKHIKYLHQVQNLYFDLCGEELPLPDPSLIIPQVTP